MKCIAVRKALDWITRPGGCHAEFDLASINQHLKICPDCAAVARQLRDVDLAIGRAMHDVAIPPGLRKRLLLSLAKIEDVSSAPTQTAGTSHVEMRGDGTCRRPGDTRPNPLPSIPVAIYKTKRRLLLTACMLLIVSAVIVSRVAWKTPQVSLETFHLQCATLIGASANYDVPFTIFENHQPAILPRNHFRAASLRDPRAVSIQATNVEWPGKQTRLVAVYFFDIATRSPATPGVLVVVPREALLAGSIPKERAFLESGAKPVVGAVMSAWAEGDLVYLCYVRGTERDLRLLWQPSSAL